MTRTIAVLSGLCDKIETSPRAFTALLRTIGNLSAGAGALQLIRNPQSSHLLNTLLTGPYEHIRKETAWVCANLICHTNEDVCAFAEQAGFLQALENFINKILPYFKL